jgi:hypothetical protein
MAHVSKSYEEQSRHCRGATRRDFVRIRSFISSRVRKEIIASPVGLGDINACYDGPLSLSNSVFCEYLYCPLISACSCVEVPSEAVPSSTTEIVLAFCYVAGCWIYLKYFHLLEKVSKVNY